MLFTGVDGTLSKDTFVTSVSAGSVPPEPNVIPGPDHEVNMLSARNLHGDRSLEFEADTSLKGSPRGQIKSPKSA